MVFARFGRPLLNSAVDTITNPQTYIRLGNEASEVLGRTLPQRFQGAGFQNLPAQFTGALDALSGMAPGAAKETARNKLKQSLQQAARAQEPGLVRPFGQTAEGALRAPNIGSAPLRAPVMNAPASTTLPQAGGPLARDYALGRSSGATKEMGAVRKLLEQTPAKATSLLGKLNPLNNAGRILNPNSFRGGILYGTAAETLLPRLGLDQKNTTAVSTALTMPGGPAVKALAGLIAYDVNNPVADGTLQAAPKLTAEQIKKANKVRAEQGFPPLGPDGEVNNTQQPINIDQAAGAVVVPPGMPVRDDRTTPNLNSVTTENGQVTTPINLPAPPPDPQLASTPAQNAGAMDPYAYQLAVYGQGRQAIASQNADAAVRDLGLSIHQRLYPQFYADKNNIPTTQEQVPNAMTIKDSQYELGAATQAVEELLDPSILEQLNAMNLRRTGY